MAIHNKLIPLRDAAENPRVVQDQAIAIRTRSLMEK